MVKKDNDRTIPRDVLRAFVFGNHELTNLAIKKYIVWLPSHFSRLTL
jgi:hypothetical protein